MDGLFALAEVGLVGRHGHRGGPRRRRRRSGGAVGAVVVGVGDDAAVVGVPHLAAVVHVPPELLLQRVHLGPNVMEHQRH